MGCPAACSAVRRLVPVGASISAEDPRTLIRAMMVPFVLVHSVLPGKGIVGKLAQDFGENRQGPPSVALEPLPQVPVMVPSAFFVSDALPLMFPSNQSHVR